MLWYCCFCICYYLFLKVKIVQIIFLCHLLAKIYKLFETKTVLFDSFKSNLMDLIIYSHFKTLVLIFQGALYFGVEMLLLKCKTWFSELSSSKGSASLQLQLDDLIHIWKFGLECGEDLYGFDTFKKDKHVKSFLSSFNF